MQVPNNYETDLIYPIIARAAELANVNYTTADDRDKTYLKVCTSFQHVHTIYTSIFSRAPVFVVVLL